MLKALRLSPSVSRTDLTIVNIDKEVVKSNYASKLNTLKESSPREEIGNQSMTDKPNSIRKLLENKTQNQGVPLWEQNHVVRSSFDNPEMLRTLKQNKVMPFPNEPAKKIDDSPYLNVDSQQNSNKRLASDHSFRVQEIADENRVLNSSPVQIRVITKKLN